MDTCPVCRGIPGHLARTVAFDALELSLVHQLNPLWTADRDCICDRCIRAVRTSAIRLREKQSRPPRADGFREYARYHLSRRDSGQWHHVNAEIAKWRQRQIVDRVSEDAVRDGCECWVLYDCDERMIAQGLNTRN